MCKMDAACELVSVDKKFLSMLGVRVCIIFPNSFSVSFSLL